MNHWITILYIHPFSPSVYAGIKERKPRTVTSFNNLTLWFLFNFQVEIEGLTGEIRFNDDGRRHNYTLHVVEMTVNSAMVKVNIFFFSFLGISYSLFHHYLYTKISNHISRSRGKREENIKITQKKRNVAIKFSFFIEPSRTLLDNIDHLWSRTRMHIRRL